MSTQAYMESFQNTVDVIEHSGGSIGIEPGVIASLATEKGLDMDNMTDEQEAAIENSGHVPDRGIRSQLGQEPVRKMGRRLGK